MRWSMWPASIAVHVVLLSGALIVPLTADDDLPPPAPLKSLSIPTIKTVSVPPDAVARLTSTPSTHSLPSVVAADSISPAPVEPDPQPGPVLPNVPVGTGSTDIGALGSSANVGEPPVPPPPPEPPPPAPKLVRVGAGVKEPVRVSGAPPEYPLVAREARVQGTVILEAVINDRGRIERVRVLRSQPLLDAAAISAVQNWRYTPTLLNGVPVSVLMTITINFTLQN